jgi:hypothetical protein
MAALLHGVRPYAERGSRGRCRVPPWADRVLRRLRFSNDERERVGEVLSRVRRGGLAARLAAAPVEAGVAKREPFAISSSSIESRRSRSARTSRLTPGASRDSPATPPEELAPPRRFSMGVSFRLSASGEGRHSGRSSSSSRTCTRRRASRSRGRHPLRPRADHGERRSHRPRRSASRARSDRLARWRLERRRPRPLVASRRRPDRSGGGVGRRVLVVDHGRRI